MKKCLSFSSNEKMSFNVSFSSNHVRRSDEKLGPSASLGAYGMLLAVCCVCVCVTTWFEDYIPPLTPASTLTRLSTVVLRGDRLFRLEEKERHFFIGKKP